MTEDKKIAEFRTLFQNEYQQLCRYAMTFLHNEQSAEDVVQETFIKIWQQKKELLGTDGLNYYLVTAVRNNCISVLRKQKFNVSNFIDQIGEQYPTFITTDEMLNQEHKEMMEKITHALNLLPPRCREIFLLIKLQGMTYKQAASVLELSVKTVENQMTKAGKIFKELQSKTNIVPILIFLSELKN